MRILIVEDDRVCQKVLSAILERYGEVEVADNGAIGYEKFVEAQEQKKAFDLVCLDIMMPEATGTEVLAAIREYEEQECGLTQDNGVKVIMTTALDDPVNVFQAHASGVVQYLVKPIDRSRLVNTLKELKLVHDAGGMN